MTVEGTYQIGEVAEAVGLSIRTIRHYDELGLVEPTGRSAGGFRLYTDPDVERLRLIKHLKPLQFSLEEIQELLVLMAQVASASDDAIERMEWFAATAEQRCDGLRNQLAVAEEVARELRRSVSSAAPRRP